MKKCRNYWIISYICICFVIIMMIGYLNRTVTIMAEGSKFPRSSCIVIDPGHGGVDGGAVSCSGVTESKINLDIALRLNDLFHLLGYETKMIRTEDISVYTKGETIAQKKISDLKERVRIVNETENGILVSIHQNYYPNSQYCGPQIFYAEEETSRTLANQMQGCLTNTLNQSSKRKAKAARGIYLMEHIEKPGILIECGFLSNPQEEHLLRDSDYQRKLVSVISVTVSNFLSNT